MVDDEWRGLRRDHDGALLFYGWPVFGHILPLIAVVRFPCFANGVTVDSIGAEVCSAAYVRKGLVVEWFGKGFCAAFGPVQRR